MSGNGSSGYRGSAGTTTGGSTTRAAHADRHATASAATSRRTLRTKDLRRLLLGPARQGFTQACRDGGQQLGLALSFRRADEDRIRTHVLQPGERVALDHIDLVDDFDDRHL